MSIINKAEFEKRIDNIRSEMDRMDLSALIVYGDEYRKENLRYVSNFWPIFERGALFIGKQGKPILAGAPEGERYAKEMSPWKEYKNLKEFMCVTVPEEIDYPFAEFASVEELVPEILADGKNLGVVGLDFMPEAFLTKLRQAAKTANIVPADDILIKLRLIKSPSEIQCLKKAGELACIGYQELMKEAMPGNTELYATGTAEGAARKAGAEAITFTVFGSGKRSETIIGRPTEKIIEDGDMIMAAFAVQYEGYVSTVEFPFVAGTASAKQKELIRTLIDAANEGFKYLRDGIPAKNFVSSVRNLFRAREVERYDLYPPLHGCGLAEAESPYPDEKTDLILKKGMTVNTDVSLWGTPGGSNRLEEGFVITDKGFESLTPFIRTLGEK